ncbi:ATP synthase subunit a like [Actinidia chinensis var. chinensis]|uniref:ATP synthase subunit a like n=1 Tax=Actinidia chinensis var. chinensis TaxID=1590841 RepID=A0A2R6Q2I3_ACTCC|nr:ATP synthase subunit a like [Actinidia chinensis var. chinensis]
MASSNSVLYLLLLLILLQSIPPSSPLAMPENATRVDDGYFGELKFLYPEKGLGFVPGQVYKALYKAGYEQMAWIVQEKLIPTVRSCFRYNGTITIFAPRDQALLTYLGKTKLLQYVVPMKLDRDTLKTFPNNSTILTFQFSGHLKVHRPPFDDGTRDSLVNGNPIKDWEIYNDGCVIVHGFPHLIYLLLLQTIPASSRMVVLYPPDEYFGDLLLPTNATYVSSKTGKALDKAGYKFMAQTVLEKLVPTIHSPFGYAILRFYKDSTKILKQVVPMSVDRDTFKTLQNNSTIPTFQSSNHLEVTQSLPIAHGRYY